MNMADNISISVPLFETDIETDATLIISIDVLAEIQYLTQACSKEVGGVLNIERDNNTFICNKIISMAGEDHSYAHFSISAEKVAKSIFEIMDKGESFHVSGWWHSHANMKPFLSGTDQDMIRDLLHYGDYVISIVTNKDDEIIFFVTLKNGVTAKIKKIIVEDFKEVEHDSASQV